MTDISTLGYNYYRRRFNHGVSFDPYKVFLDLLIFKLQVHHKRYLENDPSILPETIDLFMVVTNTFTNGVRNNIAITKSEPYLISCIYEILRHYHLIPLVRTDGTISLYDRLENKIVDKRSVNDWI